MSGDDMPNGHTPPDTDGGYDERGWAVFRAQSMDALAYLRTWVDKHEREEFDHHRKIEEHMAQTSAHIAAASVGRDESARRLLQIEHNERDIYRQLGALASRVWWLVGVAAVSGAVASIMVVWLLQIAHEHINK